MKAKTDQVIQRSASQAADRQREILKRKLLELIKRNEQVRRAKEG